MSTWGWLAEVVEHWLPHAQRRKDLFGVFDILALSPEGESYYVQTTGGKGGNHSARRLKILASAALPRLLLLHLRCTGRG